MVQLVYPGVMFKVDVPIGPLDNTLCRTASTYQYGGELECEPMRGDIYVMCKDRSIQSVFNPNRPIGWELIEDENNNFFYRVTQVGFEPKLCYVRWHGMLDKIPDGVGFIGSVVYRSEYMESQDLPQWAEITEQGNDGEPEVSSV